MLYPILCRCGRSLGDLADAFKMMRYKHTQELIQKSDRNINPHILSMVDDLQPDLRDIFEQLHVKKSCCRMILMTSVEFWELY